MTIREKVLNLMDGYSKYTITSVIPEYYKKWCPAIEKISKEIAILRDSKDIADESKILSEVQKYNDKINELLEIHEKLLVSIPALEEYNKKERETAKKDKIFTLLVALTAAAISAIITAWIK